MYFCAYYEAEKVNNLILLSMRENDEKRMFNTVKFNFSKQFLASGLSSSQPHGIFSFKLNK